MNGDEQITPISLNTPENGDPTPAIPPQSNTVVLLINAVIFFGLGFMIAGLIGFRVVEQEFSADPERVSEAVQGTFIALTPTPTPQPTTAPVHLTYSDRDYVLGPEDAPITLVEFADYRCGYCGRFARETIHPLMEKYDGYIRFVFRDFPIFGGDSIRAAHAAYCASQQDAFWEYHDAIFAAQEEQTIVFDDAVLLGMAEELSIDTGAFSTCLADEGIPQDIIQNFSDAYDLLGNAGTPTFLMNGKRFSGARPLEAFSAIIDEELELLGIDPPQS